MITDISIENFKSIQKISNLHLKPLTIFTGENSTGKSNILESISVLYGVEYFNKRNIQPSIVQVFQNGPLIRYPAPLVNYIIYKKNPNNTIKFQIVTELDKKTKKWFQTVFKKNAKKFIDPSLRNTILNPIESIGYSFSYRFSDLSCKQSIMINQNPILTASYSRKDMTDQRIFTYPPQYKGLVPLGSPDILFGDLAFKSNSDKEGFEVLSNISQQILNIFKKQASRIFFISGLRGKIDAEQAVQTTESPTWVGFTGENLIEILSRLLTRQPSVAKNIQKWANKFQIPDITASYVGNYRLESNYIDRTFNINLNASLSGLGSKQIVAIITQIIMSQRGDIILIEEPEMSLHPKNQVLLQSLFAEAVSQGKQIICTTHSPFFILSLSKIIKNKRLSLNDVAIYEVTKTGKGTRVKYLPLASNGFLKEGVPSFMKIESDLYQEWLTSLEIEDDEE
jgi:predicted ATP-dependent endonuclease of OLD family